MNCGGTICFLVTEWSGLQSKRPPASQVFRALAEIRHQSRQCFRNSLVGQLPDLLLRPQNYLARRVVRRVGSVLPLEQNQRRPPERGRRMRDTRVGCEYDVGRSDERECVTQLWRLNGERTSRLRNALNALPFRR